MTKKKNPFEDQMPEVEQLREKIADLEVKLEKETRARHKDSGALRDSKRKIRALMDDLDYNQGKLDIALATRDALYKAKPIRANKRRTASEAVACAVASDWHVGERVDPKTINFDNEYNPDIATERARHFFKNALRLTDLCRNGVKIDHFVLFVLGDIITGYIHDELMESNWLSPLEESLLAYHLLIDGINFLLEHGKFKTITVVTEYGNHGRLNKKPRISTGAQNNLEWMLYHLLAQHFKDEKRIKFVIPRGPIVYQDIFGREIRCIHGDNTKYKGGVGGLAVPLGRACKAWDQQRPAAFTILGHYHDRVNYGFARVNGSLIGYNTFAESIVKARYQPAVQDFFLMDRDHGPTFEAPIFTWQA